MPIPSSVGGFSVLPVSYSPSATHYMYARAHITSSNSRGSSSSNLPVSRTLFLANVPPDATERDLILFFKSSGTVENVVFDSDAKELYHDDSDSEEDEAQDGAGAGDLPNKSKEKDNAPNVTPLPKKAVRTLRSTGRTAHVIFLDSSSLERALTGPHKIRPWPRSDEPLGLLHYSTLYESLRPPLDVIREHADTYIEAYEYTLAKNKQKSKYRKGEAVVDADGFTLVTRGGAYGKTLGGGVSVASKRFQRSGQTRNRTQKKVSKEKEGFYGFQKAEQQRKGLMDLKKKWEEDKAKVEKLKASRKFKPY